MSIEITVRNGSPLQPSALAWRDADAPLLLARALGGLGADLWLAGKVVLTSDHSVATLSANAESPTPRADRDGQAADHDGGHEAVA